MKNKLANPRKSKTVNSLIRKKVKDIKYDGKKIEFTYDGKRLRYNVSPKRHCGWVGNWSRKSNTIEHDDDVLPRDRIPLLIHEGVEAYAAKRKGLDPMIDAHFVATRVERKVAEELGINPENYSWRIEKIYRTEMPKDKRRGKRNKIQQ